MKNKAITNQEKITILFDEIDRNYCYLPIFIENAGGTQAIKEFLNSVSELKGLAETQIRKYVNEYI